MKILVVDEEGANHNLFRQQFSHELENGLIKLTYATDPMEAIRHLDAIGGFELFLVLSDIQVHGMSGLEVIQAIQESNPTMRIAVLGRPNSSDYTEKCRRYGIKTVLSNPLQVSELREILNLHVKPVA